MRWQALILGGACVVAPLAILGCSLVAPLGGLTGGEPDAATVFTRDAGAVDSSTSADTGAMDSLAEEGASPAVDSSAGDAFPIDGDARPDDAPLDVAAEPGPPPPIAFVQIAASSPTGAVTSLSAKLAQAQAAGDLLVVAIGWNDTTSTISQVTDTAGNAYVLAVGPTLLGQDLSQAIYYAKDIHSAAASANSVTVSFVQAANVPDLRVAEYSGLDPTAPLDKTDTGSGTSVGPATTGSVTTTVARELLFAAGMSTDLYSAGGPGFTSRLVTSDGDLVEDRIVSATGSYDATAPVGQSCEWVLQLATFR